MVRAYKHILVATDLEMKSDRVFERAQAMAKLHKAKLSLIYIMKYSAAAYGGEFSLPMDSALEEKLEDKAQQQLEQIAKKYKIPVKNIHFMEKGSVKKEIVNFANGNKVDLIIVGVHEHHGFDIFLSSRTTAVLEQANSDVLAVRL